MNHTSAKVRQRALVILQVQAGLITATAAAQQLGLSSKTYSQWERRALAAILESQVRQAPGRPPKITDPEKEGLRRRVAELEQKLSQLAQVKELLQVVRELQAAPPGVKKTPVVQTLLQQIAAARSKTGLSVRRLCEQAGLNRATVSRWQQRQRTGQPLLRAPGPAKTAPLPLAQLREQIAQLSHRAQHTLGTGPLYRQYQQSISRRQLAAMVREIRQHRQAEQGRELPRGT